MKKLAHLTPALTVYAWGFSIMLCGASIGNLWDAPLTGLTAGAVLGAITYIAISIYELGK